MRERIFIVLFIAVFAAMMGISIIEPLMALYAESLGAAGITIGLIFAAFTIGRGIFTPLAGRWSDHHGRKRFMVYGMVAYTVASFSYLWADSSILLIIVRAVQGISSAFIVPIALAYIGDIAPPGREGKYLGTFTISMFLGLAAGPVIGGGLNHLLNMNAAFITTGIISLGALGLIIKFLPERGIHRAQKPASYRTMMKDHAMQEILLVRFMTAFAVTAFIVFLPLYAVFIGLNTAQIGFIVTLNLLVTAIPQRWTGKLADRFNKVYLMIIGNVIVAITTGVIPFTNTFSELLLVNIIMGIGSSIAIPANTAVAAIIGRSYGMGSVMGLLNAVFGFGMAAGPVLGGIVLDIGGLNPVFMVTASITLIGMGAFFTLARRTNRMASL